MKVFSFKVTCLIHRIWVLIYTIDQTHLTVLADRSLHKRNVTFHHSYIAVQWGFTVNLLIPTGSSKFIHTSAIKSQRWTSKSLFLKHYCIWVHKGDIFISLESTVFTCCINEWVCTFSSGLHEVFLRISASFHTTELYLPVRNLKVQDCTESLWWL